MNASWTTPGADTLTETQIQDLLTRIEARLRALRFETEGERRDEIRDAIAECIVHREGNAGGGVMKRFCIHYQQTFYNSVDIEAETETEARQKFEAKDEWDALGGVEDGYVINLVEEMN